MKNFKISKMRERGYRKVNENLKNDQPMEGRVLRKIEAIRKSIREYVTGNYTDEEYDLICQEMSHEILNSRISR